MYLVFYLQISHLILFRALDIVLECTAQILHPTLEQYFVYLLGGVKTKPIMQHVSEIFVCLFVFLSLFLSFRSCQDEFNHAACECIYVSTWEVREKKIKQTKCNVGENNSKKCENNKNKN